MLMQVQSGLTRYQVQKAKYDLRQANTAITLQQQRRSILMMGLGAGLVCMGLFDQPLVALALVMMILIGMGAAHVAFTRWFEGLKQEDRTVLVVRDGLLRAITVQELVVGDVLQITAGDVLPVDGLGDMAVRRNVWLKLLTMVDGNATVLPAGAIALADGQLQVSATGCDVFAAQMADALLGTTDNRRVFGKALGHLILVFAGRTLNAGVQAVSIGLKRIQLQVTRNTNVKGAMTALAAFMANMTLVGHTRHQLKEAAFRYNQDPVSWALG
ncbi:hypothetical protein [Lacticaseibacillus yichunensis]|uniref:P-type ATPase A domain-containing protein n=1 Tax=Lacticaseibacillus yichunensis TaxID=2486015 RepID=A0ABW4CRL4_9LACO|nr:hypothetical protein [Lacticaseibacillus yichunensis]